MNTTKTFIFQSQSSKAHLDILDGVRGLMAMWVLYGHIMWYVMHEFPIWGPPTLAVDVFMFISGFLMAYHWQLRSHLFSSVKSQTMDFYIRRFFRIAPLYYILLAIALFGNQYFSEHLLLAVDPDVNLDRDYTISFLNILTHFSFTFGLFPQYCESNILPDWSIGLEMQFYFLFPLLMLLTQRLGFYFIALISVIIVIVTAHYIGHFQDPGILTYYSQPSLILFKLNIFVSGMLFSFLFLSKELKLRIPLMIIGFLILLPHYSLKQSIGLQVCIITLVYSMFYLRENHPVKQFAQSKLVKFFGDTSYAVYLLHLLILSPMLYLLSTMEWYKGFPVGNLKTLLTFIIIAPVVYSISFLLFKTIEISGISLGKTIIKRNKLAKIK